MKIDLDVDSYFTIADDPGLSYEDKLAKYRDLADRHFEVDRYHEFCSRHLSVIDEEMVSFVESDEFDRILVDAVTSTFPRHEHERFVAHYRGLLAAWAHDERAGDTG